MVGAFHLHLTTKYNFVGKIINEVLERTILDQC